MSVVIVTRPVAGVAQVQISRPEALNALNMEVRQGLAAAFDGLAQDEEIRAVVLTGSETVFVAGADIKVMLETQPVDHLLRKLHVLWESLTRFPKPVIAAVEGYALGGGCELAMHADIIVAGETATFGQPEVKVGVMPGAGGTQRLLRAIGKYKTMLLVLTGETFSGRAAFEMGLASRVVPDGSALAEALKIAERIAAMPPLAVAQIKEVVAAGEDAPLDTALRLERKAFQLLFDTADQKEGARAFLDKRKPHFTGR
ncbi:enoyl-CoA hydratase/carnithine racemase [Rhodoligotrophos appendicifer]|uniref:enoyl-CoA hydratase-related protein n=1 Tax=Rhodoligotrophos appendicifer TaxID=987056 RepID=UPI0011847557|nr:enoyl-CoA hydratase-related protein [Rhodoligotrophos appendicifer]